MKAGQDPIATRDAEQARKRLEDARAVTFDQAADQYITANEPGWRNDTHRSQWRTTLAAFASPVIGKIPVADIGVTEVMRILEPLWREKTETGSRVRGPDRTRPGLGQGSWLPDRREPGAMARPSRQAPSPSPEGAEGEAPCGRLDR